MLQKISDYELELMKIIWANGGTALYSEIADNLEKKGYKWTKSTIITLLSRLGDKGLLKISKIGRRNKYHSLISEQDYQTIQTRILVDKMYNGDTSGLVATLIKRDFLSADDLKELKRFWEEEKKLND